MPEDECLGDAVECNTVSVTEMIKRLYIDLKFTYLMGLIFVILILVKLTCKRKIGLLIGLVTVSATFETLALITLVFQIFLIADEEAHMTKEEKIIFQVAPLSFFGVILLLNTCVTRKYLCAIRKELDAKEQESNTYEIWRGQTCSLSRMTCLAASVLLSFHNTAWLNISGQLPLVVKRRLFMNGFTASYARASKVSNTIPRILIHLYAVYFGVFESLKRLES